MEDSLELSVAPLGVEIGRFMKIILSIPKCVYKIRYCVSSEIIHWKLNKELIQSRFCNFCVR